MHCDKIAAFALRRRGASYNEISATLSIPKGTLSGWFRKQVFSKKITQLNREAARNVHAKNITAYNKKRSIIIRNGWRKLQDASKGEIATLTERELFLIGTALYWAEGYKKSNWNMSFCNADPLMIKVMMKYFLKICLVPREKMRVQVQLYPNQNPKEILSYWSKITGLSIKQFHKPIISISKRSKLRRGATLPFGTIRLRINDVHLVNKMKGWIEGIGKSSLQKI